MVQRNHPGIIHSVLSTFCLRVAADVIYSKMRSCRQLTYHTVTEYIIINVSFCRPQIHSKNRIVAIISYIRICWKTRNVIYYLFHHIRQREIGYYFFCSVTFIVGVSYLYKSRLLDFTCYYRAGFIGSRSVVLHNLYPIPYLLFSPTLESIRLRCQFFYTILLSNFPKFLLMTSASL